MVHQSQFIEMFGSSLQNKELSVKLQDLIERNWITYHLDGNHGGDYPRGEEFVETGIPYISANCIEDHLIKWSRAKYLTKERANLLKKGLAQNNDVLFAHNATVGPVAILRTKEDFVVLGTSLTAYRCNTAYILPEYLLAYMDSSVFRVQYEAGMQQSTRNQVPITTQRNYYFFIPPLPAQRKYSEIFQQADKSKFDGFKSQFIEMFGDPRNNPLGWALSSFGKEFEIASGGTPDTKNSSYWGGNISWIGSNLCQNTILEKNDGKYITQEGLNSSSAKLFKPNYVLVALVGATIGKCAILSFETTTNQNIAGINVPGNTNYTSEFIFFVIQGLYNEFMLLGDGHFRMASLGFIRGLPLITPPISLQESFSAIVHQADKSKYLN